MFIFRQFLLHNIFYLSLTGLVLLTACVSVSESPPTFSSSGSQSEFAVATAHPLATDVGIKILQQGGNAFDAAAAVTASLAVVEPYGSGIGGGAFWLIFPDIDSRDSWIRSVDSDEDLKRKTGLTDPIVALDTASMYPLTGN